MFNNPDNSFDIILMDVHMPILGGIEATKLIRSSERPDALTIPIVAVTGDAFDEDKKATYDAGMNAHITKPIDPQELFDIIHSLL